MTGDPAAVGHAAVDVVLLQRKGGLRGERGVKQIARRRVRHALGLACRPAGVQDEERVLGVHRLALQLSRRRRGRRGE